MEELELILWNRTSYELTDLCKIAQISGRNGNKDEKIKKLLDFYNNKNWIRETFEELSNYEKEMMECIIQNKYHPQYESLNEIKSKYGLRYSYDEFDRNSKVNLFYVGGEYIPDEFKQELNKLVEPLKLEIKPTEEKIDPEEFYANIIGRDNRVQDFDGFIKFININKIKATKAKQQIQKASLIKIHDNLKYQDVLRNDNMDFEDIRSIQDTTVSYCIMNLLTASLILEEKNGEFFINDLFCEDYQKLNKVEKIRYFLKTYLKEGSILINEIERIQFRKFQIQNPMPELGGARKVIIEYLKKCPIDKWIDVTELKEIIRLNEYLFLRKYTGEVFVKDSWDSYYCEASQDIFENAYIDEVLMEYLSTLGIVDVIIDHVYDEYEYNEFIKPVYFKVTKFGAHVLGMEDAEPELERDTKEDELLVTDTCYR